jgi:hypothetical protein
MNSLDENECSRNLRDPTARAAFLETGVGGRTFLEPIRAFHAMSAGLQIGLSELFALDMRPLDLVSAMQLLLDAKAELTLDWLSGKPSMASARGGDATQHEHSNQLSGRLGSS